MKKIVLLACLLLVGLPSLVSAQKATPAPWREMKAFHSFMSATFHPAEEGDFVPLKQKADSLLIAAISWQASAIPADYKPAETKQTLATLVTQCNSIKNAVKNKASNPELKKMITSAHDTFHKIAGECRKTEE